MWARDARAASLSGLTNGKALLGSGGMNVLLLVKGGGVVGGDCGITVSDSRFSLSVKRLSALALSAASRSRKLV